MTCVHSPEDVLLLPWPGLGDGPLFNVAWCMGCGAITAHGIHDGVMIIAPYVGSGVDRWLTPEEARGATAKIVKGPT